MEKKQLLTYQNEGFSEAFPCETTAPTYGSIRQLRIFIDRCSVEAFDSEGKMAMTNLVFPSEPYNMIKVKGNAKFTVYSLRFTDDMSANSKPAM